MENDRGAYIDIGSDGRSGEGLWEEKYGNSAERERGEREGSKRLKSRLSIYHFTGAWLPTGAWVGPG